MGLNIEAEEANRLAKELSRVTGETMTEAVTRAIRERLERLQKAKGLQSDYVENVKNFVSERAPHYDRRPITKKEWDEACGDTPEELGFPE